MRAWYFSENAYPYLPDSATYDSIRVSLPNRNFDPKVGAELYHRYLDEWQQAEDLGLDLMLNEHHQTATNLNPSAAVVLGVDFNVKLFGSVWLVDRAREPDRVRFRAGT